MNNTKDNVFKRHPLAMYFVLAFAISWLIFSPGVAANLGILNFDFDGTVLTILGGLGPILAAVVVTRATDGKIGVRKIIKSMFNWRVGIKWWAASVFLLAGLFFLSAAFNMLIGGGAPNPDAGLYLNGGNIILVILLLLFGSFGEEPGWRGFALPKLQESRSPMKATLILTSAWWLWHIPSYWIMPAYMDAVHQYGFAAAFGVQFIVLLALGILCTWVFNGSGGSILMPVLMHAGWNFWSGAFGQEASMLLLPMFLLTTIVVGFALKRKLVLEVEDEILLDKRIMEKS